MKVCVDAGHGMSNASLGVYDPGAVAGGCKEADVAYQYSLTLKYFLQREDIEFFLTRPTQTAPAPLSERAQSAAEEDCTHFVSLHLNSADSLDARGIETLYRTEAKDRPFASVLQREMVAATRPFLMDRGIKRRTDLAVLKFKRGPAALIELGFISNGLDRAFLLQRESRIAICGAIVRVLVGNGLRAVPKGGK